MLNEFLLLSLAHILAVASPGADFAVVIKNTFNSGRVAGMMTAVGIGCGISIHLLYTLLGFAIILSQSELVFTIVKSIGAIYLLWLSWQLFRSRPKKVTKNYFQQATGIGSFQAFRQGFFTNVFNPKVTVFFLVLFTSIVSPDRPVWIQGLYGVWMIIYAILWFMLVAWFFSRQSILNWYQTSGHYIDWIVGGFFIFIALRLFIE